MKRALFFAVLAALTVPVAASAQVALKGGTIHTVSGEVIEGGTLVIGADGTIAAVGKNVAIPAGAELIDVTGKVVTPGFVDAFTTLGLVEIWAVGPSREVDSGALEEGRDLIRTASRAVDGFNPEAVAIPITRASGVTTVAVWPGGGLLAGQGAVVDLDGELGATVLRDSVGFVAAVGAHESRRAGLASRSAAVTKLREAFDDARFYGRNKAAFDANRSRMLSASRLDLQAMSDAMAERRLLVIAAHSVPDIRAGVAVAREFGLRPLVVGGEDAWKVAPELARDGVAVVVDAMVNLPSTWDRLGTRADNAALLAEAGVDVILSTHDAHNVRNLRQYAGNAIREGMDHAAALRAVTLTPAMALGIDTTHGSLAKGKAGNVVVWSGDPFELSTQVERVFVGGKPTSLRHRQTALFERYRSLPRRGAPAEPGSAPRGVDTTPAEFDNQPATKEEGADVGKND